MYKYKGVSFAFIYRVLCAPCPPSCVPARYRANGGVNVARSATAAVPTNQLGLAARRANGRLRWRSSTPPNAQTEAVDVKTALHDVAGIDKSAREERQTREEQ